MRVVPIRTVWRRYIVYWLIFLFQIAQVVAYFVLSLSPPLARCHPHALLSVPLSVSSSLCVLYFLLSPAASLIFIKIHKHQSRLKRLTKIVFFTNLTRGARVQNNSKRNPSATRPEAKFEIEKKWPKNASFSFRQVLVYSGGGKLSLYLSLSHRELRALITPAGNTIIRRIDIKWGF